MSDAEQTSGGGEGRAREGRGAKGRGAKGRGGGRARGKGRGGRPRGGGRGGPGGKGPKGPKPDAESRVREQAGKIVRGVLAGRGAARTHLERALERPELRPGDEGLLTELVYGTIRMVATLDRLLDACARKGLRKVEEATLNHLRVAAYQLVFLEHAHAAIAVDAAVRCAGRRDHVRGFVNGLLRGLQRAIAGRHPEDAPPAGVPLSRRLPGRDGGWVSFTRDLLPEQEGPAYLAAATSLPYSLAEAWVEEHGFATALELARASNAPPPLALRVNLLRATRDEVLAELREAGREVRPLETPAGLVLEGGLGEAGYALLWAGKLTVQDETHQSVAPLLEPQPGQRLVDLCAAPGGKATHLAELLGDEGRVDALDVEAERVARITSAASRLRLGSLHPALTDPEDPRPPAEVEAPVDGVLVDVPCSNSGVLRRRVEVRWRLERLDWPPLLALQARLLDRALELVRPGGAVVYATCSVDPRENQAQVQAALERHPGVVLEQSHTHLPSREGGDGGYAARLRVGAAGASAPAAGEGASGAASAAE